MRYIQIFVLFALVLAGCGNTDNQSVNQIDWKLSPTFTSEGLTMRGEQGRIAVLEEPVVAGKQQQLTWHFWGKSDEITGKIAIIGYNKETGISQTLVDKLYSIPAKPKNGADNHEAIRMFFPTKGLWRLDVLIDQQPFGSIIVDLK